MVPCREQEKGQLEYGSKEIQFISLGDATRLDRNAVITLKAVGWGGGHQLGGK